MSKARIFFILFICFYKVLPHAAQAELQLEKWKTYGQMAEQSAICASFSKLMEAQSVLNQDLGALWQERRKFAGAVIRKSVFLELGRDGTEIEIDELIASYRDWVLSSLMISDVNLGNEGSDRAEKAEIGRQKIEMFLDRKCKSLFQQADEIIREQRPDLVYLLENISVAKARLNNSLPKNFPVTKTDKTTTKPLSSASGKTFELSIGGNSSLTLTLPGQKPVKSEKQPSQRASEHADMKKNSKGETAPPKLVQISSPVSRPLQMQIKTPSQANNIKAALSAGTVPFSGSPALIPIKPVQSLKNGLSGTEMNSQTKKGNIFSERLSELLEKQAEASLNLRIPGRPANTKQEQRTGNYFAQLGAFVQLDNAEVEKQRLENKFTSLFARLPLKIAEIKDSGPRFYRIQTMTLSQKNIRTLCDMLWPHKIACVAKPENTR